MTFNHIFRRIRGPAALMLVLLTMVVIADYGVRGE